jgi:hypothetical protein
MPSKAIDQLKRAGKSEHNDSQLDHDPDHCHQAVLDVEAS